MDLSIFTDDELLRYAEQVAVTPLEKELVKRINAFEQYAVTAIRKRDDATRDEQLMKQQLHDLREKGKAAVCNMKAAINALESNENIRR